MLRPLVVVVFCTFLSLTTASCRSPIDIDFRTAVPKTMEPIVFLNYDEERKLNASFEADGGKSIKHQADFHG